MLWRTFVEKAIYPVGLASPALTFFQAAKIFIGKNAEGVSLLAWTGYLVIGFFWFNYAFYNKIRPLLLVESFAVLGYVLIVIGIILY